MARSKDRFEDVRITLTREIEDIDDRMQSLSMQMHELGQRREHAEEALRALGPPPEDPSLEGL
jgi:prefoldin subunit 5